MEGQGMHDMSITSSLRQKIHLIDKLLKVKAKLFINNDLRNSGHNKN